MPRFAREVREGVHLACSTEQTASKARQTPNGKAKIKTIGPNEPIVFFYGTPRGGRTLNLLVRSQTLYPIELWVRNTV